MDSELIAAPGYHIDGLLSQSDNVATWSSGLRQRIRQVQRTFHDTGHTDQQATQDKNVSRSPVAFIRQLALVGRVFFDRGDVVSWLERIATRPAARTTLKFLAYMNSVDIEEFAKLYPDKLDRHLGRGKYSRVICPKLISSQSASRRQLRISATNGNQAARRPQ